MKKLKLDIFTLTGVGIFMLFLSICLITNHQEIFSTFWFSFSLVLIGLIVLFKALIYKSDSNLFMGATVFFCGIITILSDFQIYTINIFWPLYFVSITIASIFNLIIFKQTFMIIIGAISTLLCVILLLYKLQIYGIMVMMILLIVLIIGAIISVRNYLDR